MPMKTTFRRKNLRKRYLRPELVVPLRDRTMELRWNIGMKPEHISLEWVEVPSE